MDTKEIGVDADNDKNDLEQLKTDLQAELAPENHLNNYREFEASDTESDTQVLISAAELTRQLKSGNPFLQQAEGSEDTSDKTSLTATEETERKHRFFPHIESYNCVEDWLRASDYSNAAPVMNSCVEQNSHEDNPDDREELELNGRRLANALWAIDSDDEEEDPEPECTNPFHAILKDVHAEKQDINMQKREEAEKEKELSAESQMNNFIQRIQSRAAVPEYALSDAVFCVDKPKEAVALGTKLPVVSLSLHYKIGDVLKLFVSEVYSPFQFWFHVVDGVNDLHLLDELNQQITKFYAMVGDVNWQLSNYFIKPGYLCAVRYEFAFRRGRIVSEPKTDTDRVSIYFVDYGKCADVPREDLHFLHSCFAEQPALAMRGTLSDVYPLDLHWPANATGEFVRLVRARELHGLIKDIDYGEQILFVDLAEKNHMKQSISELLIEAKMAGRSQNYSSQLRAANCGRRLRYLRERLPTFDMLESQVFPTSMDDFEEKFDDIIYMPTFFQQFKPPKLANPFRRDLEDALANWLLKFQPEELAWRQLINKAHEKMKHDQQKRLQLFLSDLPNFYKNLKI